MNRNNMVMSAIIGGTAAAVAVVAGSAHAASTNSASTNSASAHEAQARADIQAVLTASAAAWSAGDLDRFMASYAPMATTTYLSGTHLVHGYAEIRAMYAQRFGGGSQAAMGELTVDIVDFRLLGPAHAYVIGHFHLHRDAAHGGDAEGPTSLVFERTPAGWRIVADHS
ncbi:SgcJ/EcaC family oxidoreductase [Novosphingobium sp. Fuku2-ISO-50]|uniref:YybH family protein n=1 Tax=Novosphingobium sp. Fuku2-ISO-50 TaxID=1739114 RepID=UPI001E41AE70|nr:SgcJ/EcaC family oxidoreductase [Novosphingobium sp. Fuku2-ISO-50]